MNPDSIRNTPAYDVLAFGIKWDQAEEIPSLDYCMLDFRAYQRPDQLTEDQMVKIAHDLVKCKFGVEAAALQVKVIEA